MTLPKRRAGRTRDAHSETASVRTVDRSLLLLTHLARQPGASLSELARHAGLSASTTYRLLETLKRHRFVEHDPERARWFVGVGAYRVGASYLGTNDVVTAARPEAERLVANLNETVNIAVLDGCDVVYVQQVEGRHMVRMFMQLGARAPLHCTGVGKALIAWRGEDDIRRIVGEGPYPAHTSNTITSLGALLQELQRVREQGYALDDEERESGVRCIAEPIWDARGQVTAAISVSAPTTRLDKERVPQYAQHLVMAAANATERVGGMKSVT